MATETATTRRGALGRALAVVGGLVGLGAASAAGASAASGTTLVLVGRWHSYSNGRRAGEPARKGDRLTFQGELHDRDGRHAGTLYAAGFALNGPGAAPSAAERLELHTFVLEDGTIIGSGAAGAASEVFAIIGGTGRYAGARGTYVAKQRRQELGGGGTAEFVLTLL
jgi:hypothetical protein